MENALGRKSYILNLLGAITFTVGVTMLLPIIIVFIYGEVRTGYTTLLAFLLPAFLSILLGLFLQHRYEFSSPDIKGAMLITFFGWVTACLFGSIPFIIALKVPVVNALFESVSGFTSSGLTVFTGLDYMPKSVLFWRALIQWLGGLGILTFFLAITFRGGSTSFTIFGAESHKISSTRPVPGMYNSIKILWGIYTLFSLITLVVFLLEGLTPFDAVCHMFTCISTGGFSTHDASIGYFAQNGYKNYLLIEYSIVFFMFLGGVNFFIHYRVLKGDFGAIFKDYELKWYWWIMIASVLIVMFDHLFTLDLAKGAISVFRLEGFFAKLHENFRYTLFQIVSILTSTGYSTKNINSDFFPVMSKQLIMALMVIGGCVGSTSGGLKVLRVAILYKLLGREIFKIRKIKSAVSPVVVNKKVIGADELGKVSALFFAWMVFLIIGGMITAFFSDLGPWEAFSGMFSALGNMGPMYIPAKKMISLSPVIKITYIIGMLAGRLEILPVIYLIRFRSKR